MPWTLKQIRYLLSKRSPLTEEEKEKMRHELHTRKHMIRKAVKKKKKGSK